MLMLYSILITVTALGFGYFLGGQTGGYIPNPATLAQHIKEIFILASTVNELSDIFDPELLKTAHSRFRADLDLWLSESNDSIVSIQGDQNLEYSAALIKCAEDFNSLKTTFDDTWVQWYTKNVNEQLFGTAVERLRTFGGHLKSTAEAYYPNFEMLRADLTGHGLQIDIKKIVTSLHRNIIHDLNILGRPQFGVVHLNAEPSRFILYYNYIYPILSYLNYPIQNPDFLDLLVWNYKLNLIESESWDAFADRVYIRQLDAAEHLKACKQCLHVGFWAPLDDWIKGQEGARDSYPSEWIAEQMITWPDINQYLPRAKG
uniref:Orf321 n=1 Tax=Ancoracysta twista TaxID=2044563 RepID=A0A2H4R8E9_9EUKA|nr:orf321 [Ancoracysta twista]ATY40925.1 orf321 [Ancoracysta twista]